MPIFSLFENSEIFSKPPIPTNTQSFSGMFLQGSYEKTMKMGPLSVQTSIAQPLSIIPTQGRSSILKSPMTACRVRRDFNRPVFSLFGLPELNAYFSGVTLSDCLLSLHHGSHPLSVTAPSSHPTPTQTILASIGIHPVMSTYEKGMF